ncbi:hypothetical protein [Leifsonia shinshuensis]|uniref:Uncharacterized protein n=1 Tax=Leifsonia shinshuensis TaxID=150026 RepID=A0A7G6YA41_9MICO|nr:hypothetical protein [Leifsonia shinshuensis]QNE35356.1 hypothetical protein F1C12_09600 [Leifsonia shinshuensis]
MPGSSPQLVFDTLAALIAGRKIRGDLPSFSELARATDAAARSTVPAGVEMLRARGFVVKWDNGRGHTIVTPPRLQHPPLLDLIDELERYAATMKVDYEELIALLASRMLVEGDWADDRDEKLELIRATADKYRARERRAPAKTSNRPPSRREHAAAAREELEGIHSTGE